MPHWMISLFMELSNRFPIFPAKGTTTLDGMSQKRAKREDKEGKWSPFQPGCNKIKDSLCDSDSASNAFNGEFIREFRSITLTYMCLSVLIRDYMLFAG
jgi:hypothetical protein